MNYLAIGIGFVVAGLLPVLVWGRSLAKRDDRFAAESSSKGSAPVQPGESKAATPAPVETHPTARNDEKPTQDPSRDFMSVGSRFAELSNRLALPLTVAVARSSRKLTDDDMRSLLTLVGNTVRGSDVVQQLTEREIAIMFLGDDKEHVGQALERINTQMISWAGVKREAVLFEFGTSASRGDVKSVSLLVNDALNNVGRKDDEADPMQSTVAPGA